MSLELQFLIYTTFNYPLCHKRGQLESAIIPTFPKLGVNQFVHLSMILFGCLFFVNLQFSKHV